MTVEPYDEYPPEDYGPQPPSDNAAEQSVLGAMLISKGAVNEVTTVLTASDFYRPIHGMVYEAIVQVVANGEPVDALTVGAELEKQGNFAKVGKAPYLFDLIQATPTAANVMYHAKIVAGKSKLRGLAQLGDRLKQLAYSDTGSGADDMDAIMGQGERFFREQHVPDDRALSFDELIASWEDWQVKSGNTIPTPWPRLNQLLNGGLERGRVYTWGARPGVGKSISALNIIAHAAHWEFKTAFFSLEMSKDEVTSRMLAAGAGADLSQILRKRMDLETRSKVDQFIKESRGIHMQVIDRERITVEQILSHARSLGKVDVVAVDYLQLLTPSDKRAQREQQVAHMSRSLKIAARELDAAVILCSQLNRGPVKDGKPRAPTIADLRESGAVEQDSDCVILLHNDEDDPGIVQMIVGKNRQGKTGDLVMNFEGRYARITE